MLKNYIKIAWRSLWNNKGTSLLNIGGLAIAMAASLLILLWVQNEWRYDNYHKDAERISLLVQYNAEREAYMTETPFLAYTAIQEAVPEVELIAMGQPAMWSRHIFEVNGHAFSEKDALFVDSNWTKMFSYEVLKGSLADFAASSNKIVISQSKAEKYFGSQPFLEQTVYVDSIPYAIAAVVRDIPANSSIQQDILIPNSALVKKERNRRMLEYWGVYSQLLFVKLSANAHAGQAAEKIADVFAANQPWNKNSSTKSQLVPLMDLHFKQELGGSNFIYGNPQNVRIFTLLAVLLLITASINFVNLSIARISLRFKEIGVRKVAGAAKRQLFTQVMIETVLSILLAIGFALLLAFLMLPHFNAFTEKHFVIDIWEGPIALLLLLVFVFVLLLTGPYPAVVLAMLKPIGLLRNGKMVGINRQGLRKVLVVAQLTLAVVMLIGILTIHRQFAFIQKGVAAYQKEQVFKVIVPPPNASVRADDQGAVDRFSHELNSFKVSLLNSSAIQSVSRVNGVSMIDDSDAGPTEIVFTGYPKPGEEIDVIQLWVDEDYGETANLTLLSGRWFDAKNVSDKHNVILNETAVKAFGLKEPVVGTTFSGGMNGKSGVVIGVVKDFHHKSLHEKIDPVILSIDPFMAPMFLVRAHAGNVKQALEDVRAVWTARYPGHLFEYLFLDEEFDRLYKDDRKALSFSIVFGGLSILISCLGLLGMVMMSVQQRTKEIGIRKVLGASVPGIVALLSRDFVKLVVIAILIASPIAWLAMNKWLEGFAYRVDIEWWVFAGAGLLAMGIALITVSFQAIKAAVVNPVESLRDE